MGHAEAARAVAIIPARLGSTRFPRKALADRTGRPMVVHVCEAAARAGSVERVVVATDADEIAAAVRAAGFEAVRTGEHPNGTSRLAEAAGTLGLAPGQVLVNVQGDEPEIDPGTIDAAVAALGGPHGAGASGDPRAGKRPWAATVASPFAPGEDPADPNIVKAVVGVVGVALGSEIAIAAALYFSRSPVPFVRSPGHAGLLKHVGIYAYTRAAVERYLSLSPTPLEQAEQLEQLRWLEHGYGLAVALRRTDHTGIDTPEQYEKFVERQARPGG